MHGLSFRGPVAGDRAFILDTWTRSAGKACRAPTLLAPGYVLWRRGRMRLSVLWLKPSWPTVGPAARGRVRPRYHRRLGGVRFSRSPSGYMYLHL